MRVRPSVAAWLLAIVAALGLAGSVYSIPIQVSEVVEMVERVQPLPSAVAAFDQGLHASGSMLRPMRYVQTWWLLTGADALGGRYHLVFRGYHALAAALLVLLFAFVARVRTWTEFCSLAFGLVVLVGMHTFVGMVREAFPANHFLLVALGGLAMFAVAQTRGGVLADLAAVVLLAVALLTLESGVLLVVIAAAAYAAGARGVSRRAIALLVVVVIAYAVLRAGYLGVHAEGIGGRQTGFGTRLLSAEEQVAMFGKNPLPLYAYTAAMAGTSVLLSQPTLGQWTLVEAWQRGEVPPVFLLQTASSLVTTALIVWFLASRAEDGRRRWRQPLPMVFLSLLVANAAVSFSYAKDEVLSLSGVFYALMAYSCIREVLARTARMTRAIPLAILMIALSSAWTMRTAGLHYKLRHGAFEARGEWAAVLRPGHFDEWPKDPGVRSALERMKLEAVSTRVVAINFLPRWYQDWWGQD